MACRVPELNRKELVLLARIGALNTLEDVEHRRDALWQVEQAGRSVGPLLRDAETKGHAPMPLRKMTTEERISSDFAGTGLTTGPHPLAYHRAQLRSRGMLTADDLTRTSNGQYVHVEGCIIARQRPGTAKGFVFLSLEDETGIANVILTPDVFESNRVAATRSRFLHVEGPLQHQEGVVHIKALRLWPADISSAEIRSHDFH
jgi:error-prone DNA polymerase